MDTSLLNEPPAPTTGRHAGPVADGASGLLFSAGFALTPPLAVLAPLGIAPLAILMAVAGVVFRWRTAGRLFWSPAPVVTLIVASIVWGSLTLVWTISPRESWHLLPSFVVDMLGGLILAQLAAQLSDAEKRRVVQGLAGGLVVGMILLIIEGMTRGAIQGWLRAAEGQPHFVFEETYLNRAIACTAILSWPIAIVVQRRWGPKAGVALMAFVLLALSGFTSDKSVLSIATGGVVFGLSYVWPRRAARVVGAAVALSIMVAPSVARIPAYFVPPMKQAELPPSIGHRILIWDFVSHRIAERPLLGWGLNSSRVIPGGKDTPRPGTENLPLHPHSAPLQWWLELGGIGAGLLALLIGVTVALIGRHFPERGEQAFALGMTTCIWTIAAVGYGIWQGWWVSALCIFFSALAVVAPHPTVATGLHSSRRAA